MEIMLEMGWSWGCVNRNENCLDSGVGIVWRRLVKYKMGWLSGEEYEGELGELEVGVGVGEEMESDGGEDSK